MWSFNFKDAKKSLWITMILSGIFFSVSSKRTLDNCIKMLVNEIELDPLRKIPFKQGSKINWVGPTDVTLDTFWMYVGSYFM